MENFSIDLTYTVQCLPYFLTPLLSDFFVFVPNHGSPLITLINLINYMFVHNRHVKCIIDLCISVGHFGRLAGIAVTLRRVSSFIFS